MKRGRREGEQSGKLDLSGSSGFMVKYYFFREDRRRERFEIFLVEEERLLKGEMEFFKKILYQ